jgi:ABC-2 type transport system permease protein
MIPTLASISLRGLLNRRRTLLLALFGGLIIIVALLYRLAGEPEDEAVAFTGQLLANFGLTVLLPVVAVIVATAALGSELDDGTIIYLLAKPIPRWLVVAVKAVVAWLVVAALVCPAILVAGVVARGGDAGQGMAYAAAAALGALEYTVLFLALSLVTSRALVVGLAYVVIWEGVVAGLFEGTRAFSVRQHALAVAEAIGPSDTVDAALALSSALAVGAVITVAALILAMRRLERVELRGDTG